MVAHEESAALARKLIEETCRRQGIEPDAAHAARRPRQLDDAASRWRCCSPTWASPRPTRGRTSRTTTRSPSRPSRRSSTGPASPSASAAHRGRARPLRPLLRLVQQRAPPRLARPLHAARRPLRPRRPRPSQRRADVLDAAFLAHPERFLARPSHPRRYRPTPSGSTSPRRRSRPTWLLSNLTHRVSQTR